MKNQLFFTPIFLLSTIISLAQWQPDIRLTNDSAASYTSLNNARCIASSGDTVHVVWWDGRETGTGEIYYKRSTDGGANWGPDTRLTNNTSSSRDASIAVSGSVVHVVWCDARDGQYEIYYKRSIDGGANWGEDTRLSALDYKYSQNPSISASGSLVAVVWEDNRNLPEIYEKSSSDGGVSWGTDTRLTNIVSAKSLASVSVSGLFVHVVWMDERFSGIRDDIYYKCSKDGGITWGDDTRLTNTLVYSNAPCISASGTIVHIVWEQNPAAWEIYYKLSSDGGITWEADKQLTTNDSHWSSNSSVSSSGSLVHLVWRDDRDGNDEIYYKCSTDRGITWGNDIRLTNEATDSGRPSVSTSGSAVHVVWMDNREGNSEIYYKRNPTGDLVGLKELPSSDLQFTVFPNPAISEIKIRSLENINQIIITDIYGEEVYRSGVLSPISELRIPTSDFPAGIYFIRVRQEIRAGVQKLIKL